ncbi:MAG TPA: mechanosensitive ion channel domain-containing protein [Flavobacterium sp.]|nr:mechanosensitive ion channel domain-containing protein [Flavobacterium sp.]
MLPDSSLSASKLIYKIIFLLLAGTSSFYSQILPETGNGTEKEPELEIPDDSLGRRTPRGTVSGFIEAVASQNYARASQYLELKPSLTNDRERERIVKSLQKLLDHGGNIMPYSWISNKHQGRTDDELEEGVDLVGTVTADTTVINVLVKNVEASGKSPLWLVSGETLDAVSKVKVEDLSLIDRILPAVLKEKKLLGVPVGHWLAIVVLIAAAYLLAWGITSILCLLVSKLWRKASEDHVASFISALNLPLRLFFGVRMFVAFSQEAGVSIIVRQRFSAISVIIGIVAFLILLWRLADIISNYSKNRMTRRKRVAAISIILFIRRAAKVAIIILGAIAILGTIGVDVTAGLAALGIGGIALALGAQKTVENFVGSVTLIADQPIRVGDFCKIGDISGTVESIGMRSTKLRTSERSIVSIPNGELAASKIENYAHRDRFLFDPVFEFSLDTTPNQIRYLLVELRKILYAHPNVNPEPAKVRFTELDKNAVKIEIWAYVEAVNFDQFQEIQEDLLLRMMDIISESGTAFTTSSQTIYFASDGSISEEKMQAASDQVKKWKDNEELQLPKFDPDYIARLRNTIDYPPKGAAINKK